MADQSQPGQAFMSALVTEHFVLLDVAGTPVPAAVIAGVAAALLAFGLQMVWMYRRGQHVMA